MAKLFRSILLMSVLLAGITVYWLSRFDLSPEPAKAAALQAQKAQAAAVGPQAVALAANAQGHFVTDVRINGIFVKGLVDTGATSIAIPAAEAQKFGVIPLQSAFTVTVNTANGAVRAARVILNEVRIGSVVVSNVEALVLSAGLDTTLIGMSFFKRLGSFEMRGGSLVLRQ